MTVLYKFDANNSHELFKMHSWQVFGNRKHTRIVYTEWCIRHQIVLYFWTDYLMKNSLVSLNEFLSQYQSSNFYFQSQLIYMA